MDRPVSPRVASVAGIMQLLHCARNCRGKRRLPEWPECLRGNGDFLPINFPGEYVNFEEDRYEISTVSPREQCSLWKPVLCFTALCLEEQSTYGRREVSAVTTRRSANKEDLQEICKHERSKRASPLILPRRI